MRNPLRRRKSLTPDGLPITRLSPELTTLLRLDGFGGTYSHIYRSQPNVRTVVDTIAREAAELTPKQYMKVPRSPVLPAGRLALGENDPLSALLAEPTPGEPSYDFWFSTFADLCIYDYAIWRMVFVRGGIPRALLRISPELLTPIRDPLPPYTILGWRAVDGSVVNNDELLVMWGYDPATNFSAVSPMETLRRLLAEGYLRDQHQAATWRNGLRKDGVIEPAVDSTKMDDEQVESYRLDLMDQLAGAQNAGSIAVLQPGHNYKDVSWSPKDAEYLQSRRLSRLEAAAAFHMPPAIVAASQNGLEASEADYKLFLRKTLSPTLTRVESNIDSKLIPRFVPVESERKQRYVEFNMDDKLRATFEERAAIGATVAGGPVVTVNEWRSRLNLPPIDGGDDIIIPMNVMLGGGPQVSPHSPTDTPAPGVQPAGTTPVPRGASADIVDLYTKALAREAAMKQRAASETFMRETRAKHQERYTAQLEKFLARQRKSPRPLKRSRWDEELANDLFSLDYQLTEIVGAGSVERLNEKELSWDQERTANYVKKRAETHAKNMNDSTETRLANEEDEDVIFGKERAANEAAPMVTAAMAFAALEVAHQNPDAEIHKTWITGGEHPRESHLALNGDTVSVGDEFSNGLSYPGDPAKGAAESANCSCFMALE